MNARPMRDWTEVVGEGEREGEREMERKRERERPDTSKTGMGS
jgi:hypothetical protein